MDLAAALATFARSAEPTEAARQVMRLSLLDWAAVALAGVDQPVSKIVRNLALQDGGAGEATVVGSATRLPARAAALVNGTTSHALDYDDTHFAHIGHPSVAIVPAALALSERVGATFPTFLDACLVGVEASVRVGLWLGREHYQAGFHQTGTAGAFGAALAGARILGLDPAEATQALGLVSTRASGLKSQFGTMGKPFNAGVAAQNGVEAALLAGAGFVSTPHGMDGSQGFGETHAGSGNLHGALDGLGKLWLFERVSHKYHACCHGTHAMLEALAQVRSGIDPASIDRVTVTIHPRWLRVCNIPEPSSGLEAKFSFRLTAAMALAGVDTSALGSFSDGSCADPNLVALRDRVVVEADEGLADSAARVSVRFADGTTRDAGHDLDMPVPDSTREAKVRAKAASLIGGARAESIWTAFGGASGLSVLATQLAL